MDLLEYAQRLVARGSPSHHSQLVYLQTLNTEQPKELTKIQPQANNSQIPAKNPQTNTYLLIGGLVLLGGAILALGYWLGKRKKPSQFQVY